MNNKTIKLKITEYAASTCASGPGKYKNSHNGEEARMHRTTLAHLVADTTVLLDLVTDEDDLPEWLEAKITKAGDYMSSAARYIAGNKARDHGQLEEELTMPLDRNRALEQVEAMLANIKNNLSAMDDNEIQDLINRLSPRV